MFAALAATSEPLAVVAVLDDPLALLCPEAPAKPTLLTALEEAAVTFNILTLFVCVRPKTRRDRKKKKNEGAYVRPKRMEPFTKDLND